MAVANLEKGVKVINHKGVRGTVENVSSASAELILEDGSKKTVTKALIARWWKNDEEATEEVSEVAVTVDEPVVEANEIKEEVKEEVAEEIKEEEKSEQIEEPTEEVVREIPTGFKSEQPKKEKKEKKPKKEKKEKIPKPVRTEEDLAKDKAEKERLKKEREEKRKEQFEENKVKLGSMRDWILETVKGKYDEVEFKQNTTYVAVKYAKRVAMEVHYRGDNCNIYILPQGEDFVDSELFNRKDGSKAWIVNQGYEVPVQQTDDVAEEILRIFEASKLLIDNKVEAKRLADLRKKAEKQAKAEKAKEERDLKRAQAKKDKERLKEIMKAKEKEEKDKLKAEKEVAKLEATKLKEEAKKEKADSVVSEVAQTADTSFVPTEENEEIF